MNFHRPEIFRRPLTASERYVSAGRRPPAVPVKQPVEQVRPRQLWRTIVVLKNAEAVADRNPDAFVVDYEHVRIWLGADFVNLTHYGETTMMFRVAAAICCSTSGQLDQEALFDALWGDREDGGPGDVKKYIDVLLHRLKPFFLWAGLRQRSRQTFQAYEVKRVERDLSSLPRRFYCSTYGIAQSIVPPNPPQIDVEYARTLARRGVSESWIARKMRHSRSTIRHHCGDILLANSAAKRQRDLVGAWDSTAVRDREELAASYGYSCAGSMSVMVGRWRKQQAEARP